MLFLRFLLWSPLYCDFRICIFLFLYFPHFFLGTKKKKVSPKWAELLSLLDKLFADSSEDNRIMRLFVYSFINSLLNRTYRLHIFAKVYGGGGEENNSHF